MPHVTVRKPAPLRSRPRRQIDQSHLSPTMPRVARLSALNAVSLQVIVGFLAPLPFIQVGHWLFGWPSVAVMFGGQG